MADAGHDLLYYADVLGASSFCDDALDLRVLVCVCSSVQGVVVWKRVTKITAVSESESVSCAAAAASSSSATVRTAI